MNFIQMIQVVEEVLALYEELSKDGTLAKLKDAEGAIQAELASNVTLRQLLTKVGMPMPTPSVAPAPAAQVVAAEPAADSAA